MKMKAILAGCVLALGLGTMGQAATCTVGEVTYEATQGNPDAVLSTDCRAGNDKNILNLEGWILGDATDGGGNGNLDLSIIDQNWSILNPNGYTSVMLVLKQSSSFGGFILDSTEALAGLWGTLGPGRSVNDYSHISAWYKGPATVVPLPAAGFLLLGALGGLVALRRKKA
jgi:hypothetical protein